MIIDPEENGADLSLLLADSGVSVESVASYYGHSGQNWSFKIRRGTLSTFDVACVLRATINILEHRLTEAREAFDTLGLDDSEQTTLALEFEESL